MKSSGTIEKYWGHVKDQRGGVEETYLLEILVVKAANALISRFFRLVSISTSWNINLQDL